MTMKNPSPSNWGNPFNLPARVPFFYGWLILPVAALSLFISGPGQTYTVSVFVEPIMEETGWSRTLVSSLYTAGSLSAAVTMVLVGKLFDRYGARLMLTVVGLIFGFVAIFMSQVTNPFELYFGFAGIRTFGQGSLTLIPSALVSLWFIRRRGKATAIASLGSSASFATFPPLAHQLISKLGWRNAWIALGFLIWGLLLPPVIAIIRRSPESVGLLPDGDSPSSSTHSHPKESAGFELEEINLTTKEALRTKPFWLLMFASSSQALISTALVFHQVSIFGTKGIEPGIAAIALTVMAVCSLIGTLIAGILSDKYPTRYILAGAQLVMIAAMLSTFAITRPWHGLLYNGILGIGGGLFMTTTSVIWPNYFGRRHLGSIRGLATTSMVGFAALGPMPFGLFFDRLGSYSLVIIWFLLLPVACAIAALLAYPPKAPTNSP